MTARASSPGAEPVRLRLVGLLLPALLVAGCGSEVKQGALEPSPTPTAADEIPWPTPPPATSTPTPSSTAVALTASGTPSPSSSAVPSATPSPEPLTRNPLALVGWWRVATKAGQVDLGLGDDGKVVHPCGDSDVAWRASPTGLFLAAGIGGDGSCYLNPPRPDLSWLESAWAFAVSGQRLLLVDDAGVVVARGVREQPPADHSAYKVTPALTTRLASAQQLPQGIRPVTAKQLARRWVPHGKEAAGGKAFVTFTATRTWSGNDGCNGASGRFDLGDFGEYLTVTGPSGGVACSYESPATTWAMDARRLGVDPQDGSLVLYDAKAHLLGRLYKS